MPSIIEVGKPSNAGYIAKIDVNPDGEISLNPPETPSPEHQFRDVNIAWYGEDRVKVTLKGGAPALIRQAYLSGAGQDVILDLVAAPESE
jgi:hypothetical protein